MFVWDVRRDLGGEGQRTDVPDGSKGGGRLKKARILEVDGQGTVS